MGRVIEDNSFNGGVPPAGAASGDYIVNYDACRIYSVIDEHNAYVNTFSTYWTTASRALGLKDFIESCGPSYSSTKVVEELKGIRHALEHKPVKSVLDFTLLKE